MSDETPETALYADSSAEQPAAPEPRRATDNRLPYWPWVFSWLLTFFVLLLDYGPEEVGVPVPPQWVAMASLYALPALTGVYCAVRLALRRRDDGRRSWPLGLRYGIAFPLTMAVLSATMFEITYEVPDITLGLITSAVMLGILGLAHMVAGALWPDPRLFRLGLWMSIVNFLGIMAGTYAQPVVVLLLGGFGLLVGAFVRWLARLVRATARRARRGRRRRGAIGPQRVAAGI
jgi:hypothetical protein